MTEFEKRMLAIEERKAKALESIVKNGISITNDDSAEHLWVKIAE